MNETILGKITNVHFGVKEGRYGLTFTLHGSSCCQTSIVCWDPIEVPPSEHSKWDLADQDKELTRVSREISKLLNDAKVSSITQLENLPVSYTFKDHMLDSWRVLTEVL